jgi:hypothetical protein
VTPGDIVWLPFPHVEDNRMQSRPALIVATGLGVSASRIRTGKIATVAASGATPVGRLPDAI